MAGSEKQFFVRDVPTADTDRPMVIGVSNNGTTIRIGDVFTTRYDMPQTAEDILNDLPAPVRSNRAAITLTVVAIEWPQRRSVEELPQGHAGALYLTGSGMECVSKNCFLTT